MNSPVDKIQMLKDSQKCLFFGLLSLLSMVGVPFAAMAMASRDSGTSGFVGFCLFMSVLSAAGLPFAVLTVVLSAEVRGFEKELWNPARPYRIVGAICAIIALASSFFVLALVIFLIRNSSLFGN